jgi:hypothetical protein
MGLCVEELLNILGGKDEYKWNSRVSEN